MAIPEDFDREAWNEKEGPGWDPDNGAWQLTKERVAEARRRGEIILPVRKYCDFLYNSRYGPESHYFLFFPPKVRTDFLDPQREMFRLLAEAVERPHWYLPWAQSAEGVFRYSDYLSEHRLAAKALACRICHHVAREDLASARDDITLGYRLANRVAEQGAIIDYLVGAAMKTTVDHATIEIVRLETFGADDLRALRRAVAELPPLPDFDRPVEIVRLFGLNYFFVMYNPTKGYSFGLREDEALLAPLLKVKLNLNTTMRAYNSEIDRVLATLRSNDPVHRLDTLRIIGERSNDQSTYWRQQADTTKGQLKLLGMGRVARRRLASRLYSTRLRAAYYRIERSRISSLINTDLLLTGLALAEYRKREGNYPERLSDLVPVYLDAVPNDRFVATPTPLIYRRHKDGFTLYSVGENGTDDGGDPEGGREDIVLAVNPPEPAP